MKLTRSALLFAAGLLAVVVLIPGGAIVAVKLVVAAKGRREVFNQVRDEVARQLAELRPDLSDAQRVRAAEILAAQAVHETGGGVTIAWREGWNFGNVTAGSSWGGAIVEGGDKEYDGDGTGEARRIVQRFRKYASLAEAVSDFFRLLNWPRYRAARDLLMAGDAAGYAKRLRDDDPGTAQVEGGYYTASVGSYTAGILDLLGKYGSV